MNKPLINDNATVGYYHRHGVVVSAASGSSERPASPTTPISKVDGSGVLSMWGDDNLFPQNVLAAAEKTMVPSIIDWKVRAIGTSLVYGVEQIDEATGKETFIRKKDTVVEQWLTRSNIGRYLIEAASDYYWFSNVFPELILSNDRSEISAISVQEATYCRWTKQNEKTGLVEKCLINANWDNGGTVENSKTVPVIDPYYNAVEVLKARTDGFKYIYPFSFPSPGKTYYQVASWDSVRKNGWLEIAAMIPTWKKQLMKNQISIKYHIDIPEYYWSWKYPDWSKMSTTEKNSARTTELTEFQDFLTGNDNAGKSIFTTSKWDDVGAKKYPGWEIKALDDKLADGKYIEDSQEASSHLLFAHTLDGTLIGSTPGKGMGAGSGSDKRVAFNMYIEQQQTTEHLILEPLHFIRDYNGWNSEYKFRFKRSYIATLDAGKETKPVA